MTNDEAIIILNKDKDISFQGLINDDLLTEEDIEHIEAYEMAIRALKAQKVGHWIKTPKAVMGDGYMWYCDKCEHQVYQDSSRNYPSENYCPNCGARMAESEVKDGI